MVLVLVVLSGCTIFFVINGVKWKVSTNALLLYMKKCGYKPPDELEIEECTRECAKYCGKSLFRNKI